MDLRQIVASLDQWSDRARNGLRTDCGVTHWNEPSAKLALHKFSELDHCAPGTRRAELSRW
jgi:hypothetical protein